MAQGCKFIQKERPPVKTIRAEDHPTLAMEGRLICDAGHEGWLEIDVVRKIMSVSEDDHNNLDGKRAKHIAELLREAGRTSETGAALGRLVAVHDDLG